MSLLPATPSPLLRPADCGALGERTLPSMHSLSRGLSAFSAALREIFAAGERGGALGERALPGLRLLAEGGGEVVHGVAAGAKVGAGVLDALREAAYLESAVFHANRHEEELAAGMVERHLHIRFSGAGISDAPHCTKPSFRKQP